MKQFFKTMFASALGTCLALGLLSLLSILSFITVIAATESSTYVPKDNSIFRIELKGSITDRVVENPFATLMGKEAQATSLVDLLEAIKKAQQTPEIKGIYLDAKMLTAGTSSVDALRRALLDFKKEGKFIIAYADYFTQKTYYLCSVADEIFMNPQGALTLGGISSQIIFYTGLAEKVGVKTEVFKVGTYKGAVEPYLLKKLSDENREQIASYTGGIWSYMTEQIADARNLKPSDVNAFADSGASMTAQEVAVEKGFIDELKYRSEVEELLQAKVDQDEDKLKTVSLKKILSLPDPDNDSENEVAVLYAEGEITQDIVASPYSAGQSITEELAKELIKLQKDEDVKAVVLRVNSPGGSAFTSEQIWKEVKKLNALKPVVVSMGDVAASGGYYISCAASKIIAETNTLTGSIGIFGMFQNVSQLFDKVGLTMDVVNTNQFSDLGDMTRPMRDDERTLIQGMIERGYETFLSRCAEGRGMTKQQIDAVGQGRVWTGLQAKEKGLVDDLGGLDKAIETAASLADLTDYKVENISSEKDFFEKIMEEQMGDLKLSLTKQFLGEELYEQLKQLKLIQSQSGIQARMPYMLVD